MTDFRSQPPSGRSASLRPPSPCLHPGERIRGSGILEEFLPAEPGMLLWESYRSVADWATTPRNGRTREMFGADAWERRTSRIESEAGLDAALRAPLGVIRDLLSHPPKANPRRVAQACRRISAWAGERGKPVTQLYFAAAAGLCLPADVRHAYAVGCLAREMARWDAAEAWLEYAATSARRQRDRETQTMATLGLGNLMYRRGLYPRAREAYGAALVLARRFRLPGLEGGTLHDLFVVSIATGDTASAEGFARAALRAYGRRHPRIPGLAHDMAYSWLTRGHASRSLRVLEALLPTLPAAVHRTLALSLLGRAAGTCGAREVFERAWGEVWALHGEPAVQGGVAAALLELAYGAYALGERARAEHAAALALDLAMRRTEVDVVEKAGILLDSIRQGGIREARALAEDEPSGSPDLLADELVEALKG